MTVGPWPHHPTGPPGETPARRTARRTAQLQLDLACLAAGYETGWYDERGVPTPWPEDFFDHNSEWVNSLNSHEPWSGPIPLQPEKPF